MIHQLSIHDGTKHKIVGTAAIIVPTKTSNHLHILSRNILIESVEK